MPRQPTAYHKPETIEQALRLKQEPNTEWLGGGTKILAHDCSAEVIDLQGIGLDDIEISDGCLAIGAMMRLTTLDAFLQDDKLLGSPSVLLRKAIRQAGANTYRNAATIGGMVAARVLDSELLAALLVCETELTVLQPAPLTLPLSDYLQNTVTGLITQVKLPWLAGRGDSVRVARTPADYPIVSVTGWQPDGGGMCLAVTGLADEVPAFRLKNSENEIVNGLTERTINKAAEMAQGECRHSGDFRGDAKYRAEMARVLTVRLLNSLRTTNSS